MLLQIKSGPFMTDTGTKGSRVAWAAKKHARASETLPTFSGELGTL